MLLLVQTYSEGRRDMCDRPTVSVSGILSATVVSICLDECAVANIVFASICHSNSLSQSLSQWRTSQRHVELQQLEWYCMPLRIAAILMILYASESPNYASVVLKSHRETLHPTVSQQMLNCIVHRASEHWWPNLMTYDIILDGIMLIRHILNRLQSID